MSIRNGGLFSGIFCLAVGMATGALAGAACAQVYSNTFDTAALRTNFQLGAHAKWVEAEGRGTVLEVQNPAPAAGKKPGTVSVNAPFDLKPFAGKRILWQADIRQENVTVPQDRWNGVKCMLCFTTPMSGQHWCNVGCPTSTSGWTTRRTTIDVPRTSARRG